MKSESISTVETLRRLTLSSISKNWELLGTYSYYQNFLGQNVAHSTILRGGSKKDRSLLSIAVEAEKALLDTCLLICLFVQILGINIIEP